MTIRLFRLQQEYWWHPAELLGHICLVATSLGSVQGDSANAVPHYQKLRVRVTHIWGNRRGQPNRLVQWEGLTLEEPPSWSRLTSTPGKYASTARAQPLNQLKTRSYQRSKLITQREAPNCTSSIYCFTWNVSSLTRFTGSRRATIAQAWYVRELVLPSCIILRKQCV